MIASVIFQKGSITVLANTQATQVTQIQKEWSEPILVYGENLTFQQIEIVNSAFGIQDVSTVVRQVATTADASKYLGFDATDAQMLSSVLVEKQSKNSGVQVMIKTPGLITSVTKTQYINAAITAGIKDVKISIASPNEITGEYALIGVYKSLAIKGFLIDEGRTFIAQEEILLARQMVAEQDKGEEFDSKLLDNVLANLKIKLVKYKQSNNIIASEEEVALMVKSVLKDGGLNDLLTDDQVYQLMSFASKFQTTSAVDAIEIINQLELLKEYISSELPNSPNLSDKTNFLETFREEVKSFIHSLQIFSW